MRRTSAHNGACFEERAFARDDCERLCRESTRGALRPECVAAEVCCLNHLDAIVMRTKKVQSYSDCTLIG